MAVKKRNKTSAEFSMSSLTDIIFLLLIFFMLTSSMVQVNMELPQSSSKTIAPTDYNVMLRKDGSISFNGKTAKLSQIKRMIIQESKDADNKKYGTVAIYGEVGVPWQRINEVMKIAKALKMRAIIATAPKD